MFPGQMILFTVCKENERLCGLVVRVPDCRPRGPGFDSPEVRNFLSSSGSGMGSTQPL
jgi:hypothetical protein